MTARTKAKKRGPMAKDTELKPGIRIDGAKRRDMNKARIAERMASVPDGAPTEAQSKARRKTATARAKAERGAAKVRHEGAIVIDSPVTISGTRVENKALRCRPGSFEWHYGCKGGDKALYNAGSDFGRLWEAAQIGSTASPNLRMAGGSDWNGLPDARVQAIDEINVMRVEIGRWTMARLVDYCLIGSTASEIGVKYGYGAREMAHILEADLRACAEHMRLR